MFLTVEDMIATFGQEELLQLAGTGPRDFREVDRPKIEEAIAHAEATIRAYIVDRWPGAFPAGTPLLKGYAADIARYRLRGRGGQQAAMNDVVKERHDTAISRLKDIAAGRMTLDIAGTGAPEVVPAANEQRVLSAMPESRVGQILHGYGS